MSSFPACRRPDPRPLLALPASSSTSLARVERCAALIITELNQEQGQQLFELVVGRFDKLLDSRYAKDADDMVQDTFVALLKKLKKGCEVERLFKLVRRVASCKKKEFFRKRERRSKIGGSPVADGSAQAVQNPGLLKVELDDALEHLDGDVKVIVLGFTADGGTKTDYARTIGRQEHAIRRALLEASKTLGEAHDWSR